MSKDSCARYYKKNKEKIQKKSRERYQNLTEEEQKKQEYKIKISQTMENKG